MKMAVFSDVHGNLKALKVILEQIKERNVDLTVFLGDIFQRGNEEIECLELLKDNEIICLKGNCELYMELGVDIDPDVEYLRDYYDETRKKHSNMEPINEGHILLVPKEHYLDVDEIPNETLSHLMIISKKIVSALKEVYKSNGYSIMQNGGEFNDGGHYHLHIFPRFVGDGFGWTYGEDTKNVNGEIAKRIRDRII